MNNPRPAAASRRTIGAIVALTIAGGLYIGYNSGGSGGPPPEERSSSGFNVDSVPQREEAPPVKAVEEASPAAAAPAPAKPAAPAAAPVSESAVRSERLYSALAAKPADFILRKTLLGNGKGFAEFCKDPARVDRWLKHPVVRAVLDNPRLLRGLLTNQAVVNGFLGSPAMQDPRALKALAGSPLLRGISRDAGIQRVLGEPGVVSGIVTNPQTMGYLARHPDAMTAVAQSGPSLAAAVGRR